MSRRALLLPLAAAALLAGCGGGEGDGSAAAVEATLIAAGTSEDPADCARLYTQRFLEQRSPEPGEAALANCQREAVEHPDDVAERVDVGAVEVDGERASAEAAFHGGNLDGQEIRFALVEEDGLWKVDEMLAFVSFDRAGLLRAMTEEMVELAEETGEANVAACILAWVEAREDSELEAMMTDPDPAELLGVAEACLRRSETDRTA